MEPAPSPATLAADGAPDRARARLALLIGPLAALLVLLAPLPLPEAAHRLAAVMVLVVVLWIGEPIPAPVTALLGPTLALLVGAVPGKTPREAVQLAYGRFGDPILMLYLGGFFIAEGMTVHGLDRRVAMRVLALRAVGGSPRTLVWGIGGVAFLLSMWVSNTATTALLVPIALGMLRVASKGAPRPGDPLAEAVFLMLPFAATVGGLATPVGTAPNLIGLAQLAAAGAKVEFLRWMLLAAPLCALMMLALCALLGRGLPRLEVDLVAHARAEAAALGPWRRGEVVVAASFGLAVAGWLGSGLAQLLPAGSPVPGWLEGHLPEGAVALLASSLLFLVPCAPGRPTLGWRDAQRIDWGTLLLLGGGLSLGELVRQTGLAEAIGRGVVEGLGVTSAFGLTAAAAGLAIALSELTSNTATATLLVPVVLGIAERAHVAPLAPALAATLGCSFGFMLPISTPPNAIAYATGLVPIRAMVRRGVVFDVVGFVIIVLGLRLLV